MTRSTRRPAAALAGLALAASALVGCSAAGGTGGPDLADGERQDGGTIVYGHDQEPPCIYGGWIQQAFLSRQVLDSLVSMDDDGEVVPWIATEWETSEDRLTWTFTIREGVEFTDGTPLDAQAVADNFDFWMDPESPNGGNSTVQAYLNNYYDSASATDATHVELKLTKPYSPLLPALTQAYFGLQSPQSLTSRSAEEICEQPVGSGPFTVEEWQRGQQVVLAKNPDYDWAPENAKHQGPAYVDKVEWKFLHDPVARFGSLTTGESDVVYDVPSPQWQTAEQTFQTQQVIIPGRPVALSLNTVKGVFTDVKVRQALAFGTDRQAAVESAFNGVIPFEGNGSVSQATTGYNEDVVDDYPYDPDQAERLLDEAGWTEKDGDGIRSKGGKPLTARLVYPAGAIVTSEGATVLQNLQAQAKEVGFDLELVPATQAEVFAGKYSGPDAYDAYPSYWTAPTSGILNITFAQNLPDRPNPWNQSFYNNPRLEELIVKANSALERDEQDRYYGEAQQIISDEVPSIGLYTMQTTIAFGTNLRDVWLERSQAEPVFHDAYFVE
jgi:peptide/nickel transport system substrate-binding protein